MEVRSDRPVVASTAGKGCPFAAGVRCVDVVECTTPGRFVGYLVGSIETHGMKMSSYMHRIRPLSK